MSRIFNRLHVLWRLEAAVAEARLHALISRSVLLVFAAGIAVLGLCMLNAAAFLALQPLWGPVWAALAVAGGDLLIAALITAVALSGNESGELKLALEMRRSAVEGVEAEIGERFSWLSGRAHDAADTMLIALVTPLLGALTRGLRKKKSEPQ